MRIFSAFNVLTRRSRSETEEAEEEAAADLFADMAPEVKAQRKLYVGPRGGPGAGGAAGHAHSGARRKSSVGARLMAKEDTADPIMAMVRDNENGHSCIVHQPIVSVIGITKVLDVIDFRTFIFRPRKTICTNTRLLQFHSKSIY